ncbi:hypothetical protein AWB69_05102 [Caballeronia udeis]|uniref:Uncharacterized protein n=1 Tax=Caballeronia udeis TaxID=1232866 RepID=A0A158I273_9BURK|nr:hypothetical protein AWB69_05102 [Caballeronia udeis]
MADVPRRDRSLFTAAAGVLPDHHRVMARAVDREDRHRGKGRVVVLRANPAAVGALRDHRPIVAAEVAMAVAVATVGVAKAAMAVGATKAAMAVGTTSSRTASCGLSPAAPLQATAET